MTWATPTVELEALRDADTLHMLPPEALIATIKHLAEELLDVRTVAPLTCKVVGCERTPTREIGGRVLVCDEHAVEYEEHAEADWR